MSVVANFVSNKFSPVGNAFQNNFGTTMVVSFADSTRRAEADLTGGITKNVGMVKALEQKIGKHLNVCGDSEYAGAIGAYLLVKRRLKKLEEQNVMAGM